MTQTVVYCRSATRRPPAPSDTLRLPPVARRRAYCVLAHDAVRSLTGLGHRAIRLDDGMLAWHPAALPADAPNTT